VLLCERANWREFVFGEVGCLNLFTEIVAVVNWVFQSCCGGSWAENGWCRWETNTSYRIWHWSVLGWRERAGDWKMTLQLVLGKLPSVGWYFCADVSVQPMGSHFKGQEVHEWSRVTVGTRSVHNYHLALPNTAEERSCPVHCGVSLHAWL
jgi:hypothetical protein